MLYRAGPIQTNQICQFSFKLSISPYNIKYHCIIIYNLAYSGEWNLSKLFEISGQTVKKPRARHFRGASLVAIAKLSSR